MSSKLVSPPLTNAKTSFASDKSKIIHSVGQQRMQRRIFLRGSLMGLGVTVGLPALDIMLDGNGIRLANGAPLPRRFGVFHWGGGISHPWWAPDAAGLGWVPKLSLNAFGGSVKPYTTVITGLTHKSSSPGHIPSRGIALSSSHDLTKCTGTCVGTYRGQRMPEPSLDQLVAEYWKNVTRFPSLSVRVCSAGPYRGNSAWKRGGATESFELSPATVFNRVFSGALPDLGTSTGSGGTSGTTTLTPTPGVLDVSTKYKTSMLDVLGQEITSLKGKLGATDKQRLDSHLDGIRDLELRLQMEVSAFEMQQAQPSAPTAPSQPAPSQSTTVCTKPKLGPESSKSDRGKRHAEVLAYAMACDLVRIFSFEWSANQSMERYPEVGVDAENHDYTHGNSQKEGQAKVIGFIMQHYAYLGEQMLARKEGDSNVLDNSLVFGTSEHADAGGHNYSSHPLLFLGKAGGAWKMAGHHIKGGGDPPQVMFAAVRAVGVPITKLGQEGRSATSPAPNLI